MNLVMKPIFGWILIHTNPFPRDRLTRRNECLERNTLRQRLCTENLGRDRRGESVIVLNDYFFWNRSNGTDFFLDHLLETAVGVVCADLEAFNEVTFLKRDQCHHQSECGAGR